VRSELLGSETFSLSLVTFGEEKRKLWSREATPLVQRSGQSETFGEEKQLTEGDTTHRR
jgi:hypothetical protein